VRGVAVLVSPDCTIALPPGHFDSKASLHASLFKL
jgi:hypothetical protein